MNKKFYLILSLLLVFMVVFVSGCDININIGSPESSSNPEEAVSSESSSASESEEPASDSKNAKPGREPNIVVPTTPDTKAASYKTLVEEMELAESPFAVAYIGNIEGPMGTGYTEFFEERGYMTHYDFLDKIPYDRYIETYGSEMYCVVPRYLNSSVKVYEWLYHPKTGMYSYGAAIYESKTGEPFFITCNGEINLANTRVVITESNGTKHEFCPTLDFKKEWLDVYETPEYRAYDFTIYEDSTNYNALSIGELNDSWSGIYEPGDGRTFVYNFNFYTALGGEHCVEFWYGEIGKPTYEYYEGYAHPQITNGGDWTGNIEIEMYLTKGTASAEYGFDYFFGVFRFIKNGPDGMIASISSDQRLMRHFDINWFELTPSMG